MEYIEAVDLTVKWWSQKSFKTPMNQNNGDDSQAGGMVFALGNFLSANAQKKMFEVKLTEILLRREDGNNYWDSLLSVDYHPNAKLSEACEFAGISTSCLPIKTSSRIEKDNKPMASYQYGGQWKEIGNVTT